MDTDSLVDHQEKSRCYLDGGLLVVCPVNDRFQEALNYSINRLADEWSHHDDKIAPSVAKCAQHLQVQTKLQIFDSFDPVSILSFLSELILACNTNAVHKGAALLPLYFS